MGNVQATVVSAFKGIHRKGLTREITRRHQLDTPVEMYNFHHTREGHLFMPEAGDEIYDFATESGEDSNSRILSVHYIEDPRGLIVQMESGQIFHVSIEPPSVIAFPDPMIVTKIAQMGTGEEEWTVWVNGIADGTLMGYAPRGSAGPDTDGKTWLIQGTWDAPTVTDLTATVTPTASYSTLYKGRRYWVKRARMVYYSELNDHTTARPVDNEFEIAGDNSGTSFLDNPGAVQGMVGWEDVLVFFLSGSVWMLTGTPPDTLDIRQVQTMVGNITSRALVRSDEGVITLGGTNLNTPSIYLFTGSSATDIGEDIQNWLLSLGDVRNATISGGKYILSTGRTGADNRQILIYDLSTRVWTAFDGWVKGVPYTQAGRVLCTNGPKLYRNSRQVFPRVPGRGARWVSGYQDDQNPSGLLRYLALKITGRHWGSGITSVVVTVRTDESTFTSTSIDLPADEFDNLVIPLDIRGAAVQIELALTPTADDERVLIENMQLITSRKGEKVGRS